MSQQNNVQKYFQLGQKAYDEGKYDEAIASFEQCIQLQPNYADAYYWRGHAFYQLGNNEQAIASFEQCIQVKPNCAGAYYWWGIILALSDRDNEAAKKFAKCIKNDRHNALAYYQLGKVFYRANKYRKAIAKFRKCIALKPDYPDAYCDLGRVLFDLKKYDEAIASFDNCIQHQPDYADAYYWWGRTLYELGEKYLNSGKSDKAFDGLYKLHEYEEAVEKFKQSIKLNSTYKADAYYWWGRILYDSEQYSEAATKFIQSTELNSTYKADAYYWWGRILYDSEQYQEAAEKFKKSIDLNSTYQADAYYWWGRILYDLGPYKEAAEKFKQSTELNSTYKADAYYWWGIILSFSDKDNEAAKKFAKCIRNDRHNAFAYYQLGKVFHRANKYKKAIAKFRKCIALKPDYPDAYCDLGRVLFDLKKYDEAIASFDNCIQHQPDYADAYYWWGRTLYELGEKYLDSNKSDEVADKLEAINKYKEAAKKFQQSIDLNSTYQADAYYWWGRTLYEFARDDEAVEKFEQSIKRNSTYQADAYYWWGKALYGLEQYKEAIEKFQQSTIEPNSTYQADAYYWWGNSHYGLTEYKEAAKKFEKSIDLNFSNKADAYYWWGGSLLWLGKNQEAIEKFNQSIESNSSYKADAYYWWGKALYGLQKYEEAAEKFDRAIEHNYIYKAEAYYWWGNSLYGLNKYKEATEKFKQCITIQPDYLEAYYWLGSAYSWLRKYEDAVKQYEKFIAEYKRLKQKSPEKDNFYYVDVYYWLGRAYYNLGKDGEVIDNLEIFIKKFQDKENKSDFDKLLNQSKETLESEYSDSFYWLGLALYIKNKIPKVPKAEEALQEFLNQNTPNIDNFYDADLYTSIDKFKKYFDLGQGFLEIRKYNKAEEYYQQAIELLSTIKSQPKSSLSETEYFQYLIPAKYYLALTRKRQQKDDLAVEQDEEIIDRFIKFKNDVKKLDNSSQEYEYNLDDYLTNSYFDIGSIRANQKLHEQARDYLEKAERCCKYRADIYEKLADIYRQQGMYRESWQELEKSVEEYEKEIRKREKQYHSDSTSRRPDFIVDYWYNSLGNIYHQYLHEYDKAEAIYLQGLKLDPNNEKILISLVNLYLKIIQSNPKNQDKNNQYCNYTFKAKKYYKKALKILKTQKDRIGDSLSLIELGNFLLKTKKVDKEDYRKAEDYFLDVIDNKDHNALDAYAGLGVFYYEQDKLDKAVECFKIAHELDLENYGVWSNLAETYQKQNKLYKAEEEFEELLAINPNHIDSNMGLGQVYLAMGDAGETEMYHQAIECFAKTRKISEHDRGSRKLDASELADLFYLQGYANFQIYQKSNVLQRSDSFRSSALKDFRNALKKNSNHKYAKRAIEKINDNTKTSSAPTFIEKLTSWVLALLSLGMLGFSQYLCFKELPKPDSSNGENKSVTSVHLVSYQSNEHIKTTSKVVPVTVSQVQQSPSDKQENNIQNTEKEDISNAAVQEAYLEFGSPGHITLTFGSFIFTIISLSLPRITRLSVGQKGVELEKSPLQQISIGDLEITSLTISRPLTDRFAPSQSSNQPISRPLTDRFAPSQPNKRT